MPQDFPYARLAAGINDHRQRERFARFTLYFARGPLHAYSAVRRTFSCPVQHV